MCARLHPHVAPSIPVAHSLSPLIAVSIARDTVETASPPSMHTVTARFERAHLQPLIALYSP